MVEQDSRGNTGAWLAFLGALIAAAVTLFGLVYNHPATTKAETSETPGNASPAQRYPAPVNAGSEQKMATPVVTRSEPEATQRQEAVTRSEPCRLRGEWTISNLNQQAAWPAHFDDGVLLVEMTLSNNTQSRLRYRCVSNGGGMTLTSAGMEAYGQKMPISFNLFDGDYTQESARVFRGRSPEGEKLLLAAQ